MKYLITTVILLIVSNSYGQDLLTRIKALEDATIQNQQAIQKVSDKVDLIAKDVQDIKAKLTLQSPVQSSLPLTPTVTIPTQVTYTQYPGSNLVYGSDGSVYTTSTFLSGNSSCANGSCSSGVSYSRGLFRRGR